MVRGVDRVVVLRCRRELTSGVRVLLMNWLSLRARLVNSSSLVFNKRINSRIRRKEVLREVLLLLVDFRYELSVEL